MEPLRPKPTENDAKDVRPVRKQFRYKTWRPRCDTTNAMRVDEALDQIGLALFPDEWGLQPDFDLLPLFWRKHKSGIFGLVPHGRKSFKKVDLETPTEAIADLTSQFSEVYRTLRSGLRKQIRVKSVSDAGTRLSLRSEMLITQYVAIFGAGSIYLQGSRRRVWINKADYKSWFCKTIIPEKSLTEPIRTRVVEHLTAAWENKVVKTLNKQQIDQFLREWSRNRATKEDVESILQNLPEKARSGGRPLAEAKWKPILKILVQGMDAKMTAPPARG